MKIAIDIVLLPPEEIVDLSFKVNKEIVAMGGDKTIFEKDKCIPHISILMCVIETEKLWSIIEEVENIVKGMKPLNLTIDRFLLSKTSLGDNNYAFNIAKTEGLKDLHKEVFSKIINKVSFDATIGTLFQDPKPEEISLGWINNYKAKQDFDKFLPHITLGVGGDAKPKFENEINFTASKIGIYQLGNYCTCRKEFAIIDV